MNKFILLKLSIFAIVLAPQIIRADMSASENCEAKLTIPKVWPDPNASKTTYALKSELASTRFVVLSLLENAEHYRNFVRNIANNLPSGVKALLFEQANESILPSKKLNLTPETVTSIPVGTAADNWARDYIPVVIFNTDHTPKHLVHFKYRAKQTPNSIQKTTAEALSKVLGLPLVESSLKGEIGSIENDGNGNLFVSETMLSANEEMPREAVEKELKKNFLVDKIHWIPPLPGEMTGHVDVAMKYVGSNTFLVADSAHSSKKTTLDAIAAKLKEELHYNVIRIMSADIPGIGNGVSMSYTNAFIVNGTAFVPTYFLADHVDFSESIIELFDEGALNIYRAMGFNVVPTPSTLSAFMGGAAHCLTSQIPAF